MRKMSSIILVLMLCGCQFCIAASQHSHQTIATSNQTVLNMVVYEFEPYVVANRDNELSDGISLRFLEAMATKFNLKINYVELHK